ncbi:hypothetical protein IEQ34_011704 [Dendrobium chrysotoxum]|uniref:B3 domain-containing protein n=1 Tax=Dendrobium chrysotoxum TaxID=161865 RepID=A0AAV7GRH4_DENCH|nr:hypothetical protein IEQ34_011704 [Dendrobium chrysotoxum]
MAPHSLRPFFYSQLSPATSSERDAPETRNFISQLVNPDWLAKLVRDKGGVSACKVMDQKEVSASDTSDQLNRFMLTNQVIQEEIKPMMTREELEAANLTSNSRICGGEGQSVGRKRGREHHGLEVMIYNRSGLECSLYLTRWDSNESPVLKGSNYKELRRYFAPGDLVEMWAFRDGADKLCFILEKLDLISKLSAPLPLPKQAAVADETKVEDMPEWVAKLALDKGAAFAWKVMEKHIFASDVSDQQNRFLIRKQIAEDRIRPAMTGDEIAAANLMSSDDFTTSKRRRLSGGEGEIGERKEGREHGGLQVMVYNRYGWGCLLYLTRWDASKASVLKGGNYREFHRRSCLAAGDLVEMWALRDGHDKLCFIIGNKIDLQISL